LEISINERGDGITSTWWNVCVIDVPCYDEKSVAEVLEFLKNFKQKDRKKFEETEKLDIEKLDTGSD